jgi:hypothetical protein
MVNAATRWSLAQVCVLIATGDASLANALHPRCTIFEAAFTIFEVGLTSRKSKALSAGTPDIDIDAETLERIARRLEGITRRKTEDLLRHCLALVWDAREKLLEALRNDNSRLIARGRANGTGDMGKIEPELWLGLTLHDEPGDGPGHGVVARPEDGLNFRATWFDEISLAVEDVQRIWPADGSAAASSPSIPATAAQSAASPVPSRKYGGRASQSDHDAWFTSYRDACIAAGKSPNSKADEIAGRKALGSRFDRTQARDSRRRLAPSNWRSRGKRTGKA